MKKIIIAGITVLTLTACAEEKTKEVVKEDEPTIEQNDESAETIKPIGTYVNEESDEDGFYTIDYEGFILKVSPKLVDGVISEEGTPEKGIQIDMMTENTRDGDVDYNGDMNIITDTKEQLSPPSGLMTENPVIQTYQGQVKEEGSSFVALKDSENDPQKITLILSAPYEVINGAVDPTNGILGEEEIRVDFTLDK